MADPRAFLTETAATMRKMTVRIRVIDSALVERDIAARRLEADIGMLFYKNFDKIEAALKATGSNMGINEWVRTVCGVTRDTLTRWRFLDKNWPTYKALRRERGARENHTGTYYALQLIKEAETTRGKSPNQSTIRTNARPAKITPQKRLRETTMSGDRCQFIYGDALTELRKLPEKSVNVILISPPYFGKGYVVTGLGSEKDLPTYLKNLRAILSECWRVLRDDGVMWIVIGDTFLKKNVAFVPTRLAMALQEDGWICRAENIWAKSYTGLPSSVRDRTTVEHEKILMFTKQPRDYYYDRDPIREPLTDDTAPKIRSKFYRQTHRTGHTYPNPNGRNAGTVWPFNTSRFRGGHTSMPEGLVRKCLLASCPENGVVLDCFGGAGTTALVALQMGYRAISIEISKKRTEEARQRIAEAARDAVE